MVSLRGLLWTEGMVKLVPDLTYKETKQIKHIHFQACLVFSDFCQKYLQLAPLGCPLPAIPLVRIHACVIARTQIPLPSLKTFL